MGGAVPGTHFYCRLQPRSVQDSLPSLFRTAASPVAVPSDGEPVALHGGRRPCPSADGTDWGGRAGSAPSAPPGGAGRAACGPPSSAAWAGRLPQPPGPAAPPAALRRRYRGQGGFGPFHYSRSVMILYKKRRKGYRRTVCCFRRITGKGPGLCAAGCSWTFPLRIPS